MRNQVKQQEYANAESKISIMHSCRKCSMLMALENGTRFWVVNFRIPVLLFRASYQQNSHQLRSSRQVSATRYRASPPSPPPHSKFELLLQPSPSFCPQLQLLPQPSASSRSFSNPAPAPAPTPTHLQLQLQLVLQPRPSSSSFSSPTSTSYSNPASSSTFSNPVPAPAQAPAPTPTQSQLQLLLQRSPSFCLQLQL